MLLKEMLNYKGKQQNDLAKALGVDKQYISKIANYKCLPTPEQAKQICEFLECNILDIYNKKEIDLILGTRNKFKAKDNTFYYRLSVRLNKSSCNCLKIENLKKLGYKTQKQWVLECMENLKERLKEQRNEQND